MDRNIPHPADALKCVSQINAPPVHGRGAGGNPANRFVRLDVLPDPETADDGVGPRTQFFIDSSRQVIAHNDSPDVGFEFTINPYHGCEHGCICFSNTPRSPAFLTVVNHSVAFRH